jgi:transaldolase/glucose-6-phosphate isomerase
MGSVASFFVSRVDTAVDGPLEARVRDGETELTSLLGKAAIANGKVAYEHFSKTFSSSRFKSLKKKGARPQRLLFGSTGTKNPAYSDVYYMEPLIGPDTVNTVPPDTLTAFLDHGVAALTITDDQKGAKNVLQQLADAGVSMREVTDKLLADGVKSFADSFDSLLANVAEKQARLVAEAPSHPLSGLGAQRAAVETTLSALGSQKTVERIWSKDHTVWKDDPTEIVDRLGWLDVIEAMHEQVEALTTFAAEVRDEGFTHVVLLGMGGSSLGPEVLRQTFGSADGLPLMHVLDSTVPAAVQGLTAEIEPAHTLFLVSSKSGTTIEALSFYRHFRILVGAAVGHEEAGESFIAITDAGSPLEGLAEEEGFRRIYLNPPDIGGRYSVLSYFGLVPAALMGIDVNKLLDRAQEVHEATAAGEPAHMNPGVWLGAAMGSMAKEGRDKMTLVTSPGLSGFGLWVEQLIAESTGKEGSGIIPVAGEPLLEPSEYDDDRLFVYVRLTGDDNDAIDSAVAELRTAGRPVLLLELRDLYDLGGEFFRWEFATAVASSVLGIHPFDQPNVQQSKDLTSQLLQSYKELGLLPAVEAPGDFAGLLAQAKSRDYLAIMAYVRQTPEIDAILTGFRRDISKKLHIATTLGYGPRFLHSTGQLHKGGPDAGLFLQIVDDQESDVPIPGEEFSFNVLSEAQALGDLQALQAAGRRVARIQLARMG